MNEHKTQSVRILVEKDKVEKLNLPRETIELLTKIGVPASAPLGVSFESCNKSISLTSSSNGEELYMIGTDEGSTICLKSGEGTVVSVDESGEELRKINSELSHFLKLLDMYSEYAAKVQSMDESDAESYAVQV